MFCIKCGSKSTQVINSRGHKKSATVWRRRYCSICGIIITTTEKPALGKSVRVYTKQTDTTAPFNTGKLVFSIGKSFAHNPGLGESSAIPLSETITAQLIPAPDAIITTDTIRNTAYEVLLRYDQAAALQYGLTHDLIAINTRRRKRLI